MVRFSRTAVPFHVIFDYLNSQILRRLERAGGALIGVVLLFAALLASVVAVPTSLVMIAFVIRWWSGESIPELDFSPSTNNQIWWAWGISFPLAVLGGRFGLSLVRGRRKLVLFLRRFGYDEATMAATFAAHTIGSSWRLVTLDDAEIAPQGLTSGARTAFGILKRLAGATAWVGNLPLRVFPVVVGVMWGVVAIQLATSNRWTDVADADFKVVSEIFNFRLPFDRVALTLPGVFAGLAIVSALAFAGLMVTMAGLLAALPLSAALIFFSSSLESVQEAERSKTFRVDGSDEIDFAAQDVVRRCRKVFGPRLVVLRVASHIWQATVDRLARASSVVLVDVSEPTENLLWELETLVSRFADRCVIVGHADRVGRLATLEHTDPALNPLERRMVALLDGREVIAYATDGRGMRRFARALRSRLFSLP